MKVGIDFPDAIPETNGNAIYSLNLLRELAELGELDLRFFHYVNDYFRGKNFKVRGSRVKYLPAYFGRPIPETWRDRLSAKALDIYSRQVNLDILHFTNPLDFVPTHAKKTIVTMHDLAFRHSVWTSKGTQLGMAKVLDGIRTIPDRYIAVSQFTKDDLVNTLNIDPEKIDVIYEGVSDEYYPDHDPGVLKSKFTLEGDYILCVGQLQERKNTLNLLRAYAALPAAITLRCKLVLRGRFRSAEFEKKVLDTIENAGLAGKVLILRRGLSIDDMRKLYSSAKLFIYPSRFEGFGLPLLEAMKCGAPVISSNSSSLPEVGGNAVLYVDPESVTDITERMKQLYSDPALQQELRTKAKEQAAKFTWQRCAKETLAAYNKTLQS